MYPKVSCHLKAHLSSVIVVSKQTRQIRNMARLEDLPPEVLGLIFQQVFSYNMTERLRWPKRRKDFASITMVAKWLRNAVDKMPLVTSDGRICRYNADTLDFPPIFFSAGKVLCCLCQNGRLDPECYFCGKPTAFTYVTSAQQVHRYNMRATLH